MTRMKEIGQQIGQSFATFVPAKMFPEFYTDLVASEPDTRFDLHGRMVDLPDAPYEDVARRRICTVREGVEGAYVYFFRGDELFLADSLVFGYQYVPLDEVWDMNVTLPAEPISDDVLAEIL